MNNLMLHFPEGFTPRDSQVEVLNEVEQAVGDGYKFIVVQAPTGSGKSHIGATLCSSSAEIPNDITALCEDFNIFTKREGMYIYEELIGRYGPVGSAILTMSKSLQDQYFEVFNGCTTLKGKSNYECALDSEFSCELAPCSFSKNTKDSCKDEKCCPHSIALNEAFSNRLSVFNYSSFLTLPAGFKGRDVLICDEASELEDFLVSQYTIDIQYDKYKEITLQPLKTDDPKKVQVWLSNVLADLQPILVKLKEKIFKGKKVTAGARKRNILIYNKLNALKESISEVLSSWTVTERVVEFSVEGVLIAPLYVDKLAQNLFNESTTVILMSATIINHKLFAETLGINKYKYIEIDSEFDADKSPIKCTTQMRLNHGNLDRNLPKIAAMVKDLAKHHTGQKGIVHTHTMKITNYLRDYLGDDPRFLFREAGIRNEKLLEQHVSNDDTIIVSPSLGFGTDLADDEGRFQIIIKTPFLPLGSKRIKTLFDRNPQWYQNKTLVALVQTCGRCTRNKDDHAITYVLDGTAVDIIKRNFRFIPKYFRDRIH